MTRSPLVCLVLASLVAVPAGLDQEGAQQAEIVVGENVLVTADLPERYHIEPYIIANPVDANHLVVATIGSPNRVGRRAGTTSTLVSFDGGGTWTRHELSGLDDLFLVGDPWLTWGSDGLVYLSVLPLLYNEDGDQYLEVWVYYSDDGGQQWSGPTYATVGERDWPDHPVIVAGEGDEGETTLYVFATNGRSGIGIWKSAGAGEAFSFVSEHVPDRLNNNLGSAIVAGPDSIIFSYTTIHEKGLSSTWAARSLDGGRTFTRSLIANGVLPLAFPMVAADLDSERFRNRVYAVWLGRKDPEEDRLDVLLSYSVDWGMTWSEPVMVNTSTAARAGGHRGFPFVAVNRAGVVGVRWTAWPDNQLTMTMCTDIYFAASLDGGASFLPDKKISSVTSCCDTRQTERRLCWGGEYSGMATGADGTFHPIWTDTRTGVPQNWMATVKVQEK